MNMLYKSTRGGGKEVTASQAILQGLSADGGLFVPTHIPKLSKSLEELSRMDYRQTAFEVMRLFLTDFTDEELKTCIERAYDSKFDTEEFAPLRQTDEKTFYLELFHGPTIAFKDMALSILPHLMTTAAKKNHIENEIVILTATSGDTGKAALAGFADVPGTRIIVFYPKYGVSAIQEKQMVTQRGNNTTVIGITGNFDDAQTEVKRIFHDPAMQEKLDRAGYQFSSANSINVGRLVPQIVYYVYAYASLVRQGKITAGAEINFAVPTGNFGNILAAWYAKQIGIPVRKLICASNSNKVLFDFFSTGCYDRNREFILTASPSMDILISSNLERLVYLADGCDGEACRKRMEELSVTGSYNVTPEMEKTFADFYGNYCTEKETAEAIERCFEQHGYMIDPHTAVASGVVDKYRKETGDDTVTVIASTASPFKFNRFVLECFGKAEKEEDDFVLADRLSEMTKVPLPGAVEEIRTLSVLHDLVVDKEDMASAVLNALGIGS